MLMSFASSQTTVSHSIHECDSIHTMDTQTTFETELTTLPRLTLTPRQLFDLEQIVSGGFAPLTGFLNKADYESVVEHMHLVDGSIWPMPIVLDVGADHPYSIGERIILCDAFGNPIAFFTVESIYTPDKEREALKVYGTTNQEHPGVRYMLEEVGSVYLGGPVEIIAYPGRYDFKDLRWTPEELKKEFKKKGWNKVVAFQTRNPIHRAHFELITRAADMLNAKVLLHPVVGITKEGDIDYITRVRAYKRLHKARMQDMGMLALLPLAMRMAGPREALWHALVRKNYGATHFIVGRDHAGPGSDSFGKPFYGPYEAQELAKSMEKELGIGIVPVREMAYVESENRYFTPEELQPHHVVKTISGTEFRRMLRNGEPIPEWFSFPEVIDELRGAIQKEKRRGVVVFFTGLSGAGKSTIAHMVYNRLLEKQDRPVTYLDGDVIRQHLSKGLGFSKEGRMANIERIGFVASEIAKHGGIAICAAIAPYRVSREKNRRLVSQAGTYIEVFVDTPIAVCEKRDPKGLYRKAKSGKLAGFTGVDDPYEPPTNAELTIDTTSMSAEDSAEKILNYLHDQGFFEHYTQ